MKDYNFHYKVSDILRHPEFPETIHFSNKFSTLIPQISDTGISADIYLQGLNDEQVQVTLLSATCTICKPCDHCGEEVVIELSAQDTESIAEFPRKIKKKREKIPEADMTINQKMGILDLEEMITTDLRLSEPVVILCLKCQKTVQKDIDKDLE